MNRPFQLLWKHLPSAASVAVGVVPVLILVLGFDVSRKIIAKGALAYAAGAVGLKLPLYHLLVTKVLHKKLTNLPLAVSQGIVSALSELGAAFGFFVFVVPTLSFAELVGFGVAAGSIEAIILPFMKNPLQGTPLEEHAEETAARTSEDPGIQWLAVVERVLASLLHIATRGLVYVSCSTGNPFPAVVAFLGFASIDGRAYYAHLEKWQFENVRVLGRFYCFLGLVAFSMLLLFLVFYYSLMQ